MIKYSFAKVNLALDILGKDENGYHKVQTLMQELKVMDEVMIDARKGESNFNVRFRGDEAKLIDPQNNTVIQAIKAMNANWSFKHNYNIIVEKNIPIGAGLGGGSSNAASIILALNEIEEMGLSNDEMRRIAAEVGVDTPFFIEKETALGTGNGNAIEVLPKLNNLSGWSKLYKLLVIPTERKSTTDMYAKVDLAKCGTGAEKTKLMVEGLKMNSSKAIFENLHNDFEIFADESFAATKKALLSNGASHVILCGSGTAVLALSSNPFDLTLLGQALPHQRILNLNQ